MLQMVLMLEFRNTYSFTDGKYNIVRFFQISKHISKNFAKPETTANIQFILVSFSNALPIPAIALRITFPSGRQYQLPFPLAESRRFSPSQRRLLLSTIKVFRCFMYY